ncbi:MAG TPA: hypothetical protein VND64_05955 [Pirellulales bacterium]|nr:hypothetical protein [Pirellulales bacterium]
MIRIFCCGALFQFLSLANGATPWTAEELQDRALSARRSIKSGVIEVAAHSRDSGTVIDWSRVIYFDGSKLRGDLTKSYSLRPTHAASDTYTEVSCFGCYADDMHVWYTDMVTSEGGRFVISVTDPDSVSSGFSSVPDPRWIGFLAMDILMMQSFHLDFVVGSESGRTAKVENETLNGVETCRLEFLMPDKSMARVWLAPAMDFSVVRNQFEFNAYGVNTVDTVNVAMQKHAESGLFFPKSARYERHETRDGETSVTREEDLTVRVRQLNERVDAEVFSVKGIEILKPGTTMQWVSMRPPPASGQVEWDGERFSQVVVDVGGPLATGSGARKFFYINAAIISAIVALVALRRYYRGRASLGSASE